MASKTNAVKRVKIKLPRVSGEGDKYVSFSNGVDKDESYLIQRGKEVEVPEYIYEILKMSENAEDIQAEYIEATSSED